MRLIQDNDDIPFEQENICPLQRLLNFNIISIKLYYFFEKNPMTHNKPKLLPIAKEGYPFIAISLVFYYFSYALQNSLLTYFFLFLSLFIIYFFRDPERTVPTEENLIVSPADGKVVAIKPVIVGNETYNQISIFLSVFNVHINRAPITGMISDKKYNPGKFLVAFAEKASEVNEQTSLTITNDNKKIIVKQIAGLIARRIVCWPQNGDMIKKGDRFGLIKFGSRVDLLLPSQCKINVNVGEKVKGGSTIIGELR